MSISSGVFSRPGYHLAEPNKKEFYETAFSFQKNKIDFFDRKPIGGIVPHHLLAADLIAQFYGNLQAVECKTIILLGPNHYDPSNEETISSVNDWETPFGRLEADREALSWLARNGKELKIKPEIFTREHSIASQAAFIKKTFPQAKFVPLVLGPLMDGGAAEKLGKKIFELGKKRKIFVISSVDFSHNENSARSFDNDRNSMAAISDYDFSAIYDSALDSPPAIYVLMEYSRLLKADFELLNNSNSAVLTGKNSIEDATSYVTAYFTIEGQESFLPENQEIKSIRMLFFGDAMIDRHVKEKIDGKGFDHIFEGLSGTSTDLFRGFDLVSTNLEGAVTDAGRHFDPVVAYDFAFDPVLVGRFKDYGFNYFSIANNHFYDQGARGVVETRENLSKLGYLFSGSPDRVVDEWSATSTVIAGQRIALLSFSMVYGLLDEEKALEMVSEAASSSDLAIVNIHWGVEYEHRPNRTQIDLAHRMIEAGADLIIGHHPHVVQGIEEYQGKLVFYSLGNFIFDQYFSADTQEGLAVGATWTKGEAEFALFPFHSKQSRLELMSGEEKSEFLRRLASWSPGEMTEGVKKLLSF